MAYCTESDIEMFLQMEFDGASTPKDTEVTSMIVTADSLIDRHTQRVWSSTAIANSDYEYHDGDGSKIYLLKHTPIISVDKMYENTASLGAAAVWVERSEGWDKDFLLYEDIGKVFFHNNVPGVGFKNIRFQYTHGYATTPAYISRMSVLLTGILVIQAITNPEVLDNLRGYSLLDLKVFKYGQSPKIQAYWNEYNTIYKKFAKPKGAVIAIG